MKYTVLNTGHEYEIENIIGNAYLVEDQWDDWFEFSTMYDFYIIDDNLNKNYIGKIKIGQSDMNINQRRPKIPSVFTHLSENFFSLGQSDYYYERLKALGNQLRITVLNDLHDMAFDLTLFNKMKRKRVSEISLLRDISDTTVTQQFNRIANGGARLTEYYFEYQSSSDHMESEPMKFSFSVKPESNPPTNIHVIIGRNGVGKTHLIRNMVSSIVLKDYDQMINGKFISQDMQEEPFSRVVVVSFSAFDDMVDIKKQQMRIPYIKVGLPYNYSDNNEKNGTQEKLAEDFASSFLICAKGAKADLFQKTIVGLQSDPIFSVSGIFEFCKSPEINNQELKNVFKKLSSGHKVIILTVVKLIQYVEEKTLVFLDEPEGHLHPPLLSAFIRSLSELLIDRNGVAIIATHSPVILQEVPRNCAWKLRRNGAIAVAERLQIESFGESVESLTNEVFGLEVTHSGYHKLLQEAVNKYGDYNTIIEKLNGEIGNEARYILKMLLAAKPEEIDDNE